MPDLAEVFGTHAEHRRAIYFRLPAHVICLLGMQQLAILILPGLFRVIPVIEEDGRRVPVQFFLRQERAALENQDLFPACARWSASVPPPAPVPITIASYSVAICLKIAARVRDKIPASEESKSDSLLQT